MLKNVVRAIDWVEWRNAREYVISDKGGHPLDRTKTSYCQRMWGRMSVPSSGRPLTLNVQTQWWNEHSREEQLGLIVHEATHIKHQHHKPEFWEVCIENYKKIAESAYFPEMDWEKVGKFAEEDPNSHCVDRRSESVEERKKRMAEVKQFG